jgi:hypothetical protein
METRLVYEQGTRKPGNTFSHVQKAHQQRITQPQASGSSFRTVVVFKFCKKGAPMNTPEMADVPMPIQLFGNNRETCRLL